MGLSIDRTYSEYADKLHSIEEELHAQPITEEIREQIIHELDEVHENLSKLETTAVQVNRFALSFLEELRQKTIQLYGETDEYFFKNKLDVIQKESLLLGQILEKKDLASTTALVDKLKSYINQLLESYRPGLQERRILVFAKLTLDQAEALLKGELLPPTQVDEWTYLELEEIIQEIAEYLGNNDRAGIRFLWSRLNSVQKRLLMGYLNPEDLFTCLLHDVKGTTDQDSSFGLQLVKG